MSFSTCCTELGKPASDLSVSSLCAQRAVICGLTSQNIQAVDITAGRVTTEVIDADDVVVNDLTVLGSISFISTGGGGGGGTPFSFCADPPLEISPTTGCFAITDGTTDVDTLVYSTTTNTWTVSPLPSLILAGSVTLTFGTGSSTVNVDTADLVNLNHGTNGNPPLNPGINSVMRYYKVGSLVTCDVAHEIACDPTSFTGPPNTLYSEIVIKNLPFRGTPFTGQVSVQGRGNVTLEEYINTGVNTQAIAGAVFATNVGGVAGMRIHFSMDPTTNTFRGTSVFQYASTRNTP
jgi:hypothetical protein